MSHQRLGGCSQELWVVSPCSWSQLHLWATHSLFSFRTREHELEKDLCVTQVPWRKNLQNEEKRRGRKKKNSRMNVDELLLIMKTVLLTPPNLPWFGWVGGESCEDNCSRLKGLTVVCTASCDMEDKSLWILCTFTLLPDKITGLPSRSDSPFWECQIWSWATQFVPWQSDQLHMAPNPPDYFPLRRLPLH